MDETSWSPERTTGNVRSVPNRYRTEYVELVDRKHRSRERELECCTEEYEVIYTRPPGTQETSFWRRKWVSMDDTQIVSTQFTTKNSSHTTRYTLASILQELGFAGPVKGGHARCLRLLYAKMGYSNHVIRGWSIPRPDQPYASYRLRGPHYMFRSPIPGIGMNDVIKLALVYKEGYRNSALKRAITELLNRPPEDIREEIQTFGLLDLLSNKNDTPK